MSLQRLFFCGLIISGLAACNSGDPGKEKSELKKGTYAYDADFLRTHTNSVIELQDASGQSRVLLSPDFQGRVMTSTARGDSGISFGWLNYDLLASGEYKPHINAVGGEERFWMGPEGGQFSIFFNGPDSFVFKNWQVPAIIDTVSYEVLSSDKSKAVFIQKAAFKNYSGTPFEITINRGVQLLEKSALQNELKIEIPATVSAVGYATDNRIVNSGSADWKKDNGLLSIWLLGMFTPTPKTVVIIPFKPGADARAGITDNYFGSIPSERLIVKDSFLVFTCDGKYRSKIGLAPGIAKPVAGSFDFDNNVLTIVIPEVHPTGDYVNSKWEFQKEPYKGDVINSYNDGPVDDGTQLGPFYEIESSSPAKELRKGEKLEYRQVTCHLQGSYEDMRTIAQQILQVDLNEIKR